MAAHQSEGDNFNDWSIHEAGLAPAFETAGKACNSYEMFKEDRRAVQELNGNAHRFSLEWSRIEPEPGVFSEEAIEHYKDVLDDLLLNDQEPIEPLLTLHHFTNPVWFHEMGGWEHPQSPELFERFVSKVVTRLDGRVRFWITINEPNVMVQQKYIDGAWHPHKKSIPTAYRKVYPNLIRAHKAAYRVIKQHNPDAQVSIANNYAHLLPAKNIFLPINYYYSSLYSQFSNNYMYGKLQDHLDFLGVNFYTRIQLSMQPFGPLRGLPHIRLEPEPGKPPKDFRFDAQPKDLTKVIKYLAATYKKPIMITENGYVSPNDEERVDYIRGINEELLNMRSQDWPIIGYFYWSLLDNYEWNLGFSPQFGLYTVDRTSPEFTRIKKPSADVFAQAALEQRNFR